MVTYRHAAFGALLLFSALANAQADQATIDRIVKEGKMNNQVMAHLEFLSVGIGHRLTTSPGLDRAYHWTMAKFKEFGCVNVHLEEWGEWPVGFHRGPSYAKMTSPEEFSFEFTTPSWGQGTNGPTKAKAVPAPTTMEEFEKIESQLKGAWVVYKVAPPRPPRTQPGQKPPELTAAQKDRQAVENEIANAGILGRVLPSNNELVLTSGSYANKTAASHPKDINVTIRKSDMAKVFEHIDGGKPVELEFDLNNRFIEGPIKNYNVIAEIPGTEKPDEVVILGAHIDSWDGPGSQGAADNGTGVSTVLEAARILNTVGAKPKRTIRFILFSGEEQGLHGSRRYVEMHKDELDKISCVFIEDGGANYEGGAPALESMIPMFQPLMDTMNAAFPDLPVRMRTVAQMPRGGGSDHAPFNAVGVPGFFWDEVGTFDYTFIHHTQHDYFSRVPANYMIQSATNSAVACYVMANAATMMPRAPKPATPPTSN